MQRLEGKTIVVGLSGGIACYKVAELVRLLRAAGARVRVVMTRRATEFITPLTLQTLAGERVATELFDLTQESEIGHIQLADTADALVIAPATANCIAKVAAGMGDDLLTTILLATRAPVLLAPSMNVNMFENSLVQANLEKLRQLGHRVIAPGIGSLACGYEGAGRLADPVSIVREVERAVSRRDFSDHRVLVTAGPNRESIDPVRFISNRSSGRMGYALAGAAWRRGATVTLISGPTALEAPHGVRCIRVMTAAEVWDAVMRECPSATMIIMAAAVADYRPVRPSAQKLRKTTRPLAIEIERTADILGDLRDRKGNRVVVGFAAETENLVANAERKLRDKGLDLIVANDVAAADTGFEVETNAVVLIDAAGQHTVPLATKDEIADRVLDRALAIASGVIGGARPRTAPLRAQATKRR